MTNGDSLELYFHCNQIPYKKFLKVQEFLKANMLKRCSEVLLVTTEHLVIIA